MLGEALQRSASAFNTAHTDLDKSIAIITASNEVLQDPEKVGTMWNTVSARIRGAATELVDMGEETDQYVESTSKLRDLVKGYTGFDIMDDENNFKDLYEIVLGIGEAWGDLEDIQKAALGEALGGKRNARGLYSIFDHLDTLTSAYETSVNSAGSAAREQEHYAESIQYSIDRTKASLQELSVDFLSSDLLKGLIEGANRVLQVLDDIISRFGTIKTLLAGASIADFGRGLFTGKGVFAGIFEHLAGKSGEASASGNMLSNILTVFGSSKATKEAMKAGEGVVDDVAEGAAKAAKNSGTVAKMVKNVAEGTAEGAAEGAAKEAIEKTSEEMTESAPKTAKNFVSKFVGAISAHPIAAAIGGVAIAGLIAKNAYDRYKANQISTANTATDKYNDTKATIESYKSQYQTLYKQLHDANTTEAEGIEIRKQIVDLQSQITEQYGAQASGVDLVNGKLDEQLSKLDQIVSKNAQDAFADGDTKKAYKDATKEMNRQDREYSFGFFNQQYSDEKGSLHERIQEIADEIEGVTYGDAGNGFYELKFNGNVTDAEAAIETLKNRVVELRRDFKDDDSALFEIDQLGDNLTKQGKKVSDTIGKYRDNWLSGLEQGFHEEFYGKEQDSLLADYEEANRKYNESIASEDVDAFAEAQAERQEILAKLQDTYGNDEEGRNKYKSQIEPLVSDMDTIIDKSSEFKMNVRDLVDENGNLVDKSSINNTNEFKDNIDGIKESFEELKNLNLDEADFKEMTADIEKFGESDPAIKKLGESLGLSFDDVDTYADNINLLSLAIAEMGGFTNTASTETEEAAQKFEDFRSSIIKDIANIDTLNAAIAESVNGKGLSYSIDENGELVGSMATIKAAYQDLMDGTESQALFERTANGIHVNQEKLRELKSELQASKIKEFTEQETNLLKEQQDIRSKINSLTANGVNEDNASDLSTLQSQLDAVGEKIGNLKDLRSAWEGATSAYQQWVESQSAGEEGDMYNTIRDTALKRGEELWTAGLTGTNEFRAIAQMLSNEDLTTAPIEKIEAAYQNGSKAVKQFFTDDVDGLLKFSETVQAMGDEVGYVSETDDAYNFFGIDMDAVAEKLGVSRDIVDAIFRRFSDYGYNTRFFDEDQVEELQKIKQGVDEVQSALKDSADFSVEFGDGSQKSFSDIIDFDFVEIGEDADALNAKLAELQTARADPDINSDQAKLLDELIQLCIQDLDILNGYHASPDGPNLETWETSQTLLQGFEEEMQKLDEANVDSKINLTIEDSPEAMKIVDAFMNDPDLALMAHIDISKGRDDVIRQLEEMHTNGVDVSANVDSGNVQEEVSSAVSGASGTPDVKVDEGSVASQTQEGIKAADGTTVIPHADADQAANETKSKIEGVKPKVNVQAKTANFASQITNAAKKAAGAITGKKTTQETVSKETKETTSIENKQTNITVSGNYDEAVKIRTAVASIPDSKNVKVIVDTGNAITGINRVVARVEAIKDKEVKITANDGAAITKINTINRMPINPKSLTISHNLDAVSTKLNTIISKLAAIRDKNVTVRVNHVSAGNASANPTTGANGTAHWQGTAGGYYSPKRRGSVGNSFINHYNGTAYARGNWGLKRDEPNALINELGPEIVVLCKICYHVWRHACKITSNC